MSTGRSRATRCASATRYAPTDGRLPLASDGRRATPASTSGSPPTACSRSAFRGFKSWGDYPNYLYFGGNSEMRGYDYLEFIGNKAFFANAELRFPLIEAALTPIGVVGGLRAVAFANFGGARLACNRSMTGLRRRTRQQCTPDHRVHAGLRIRSARHAGLRPAAGRSPASAWSTAARPTASASRPSRSASRSTSTGRGARCSTRAGKTTCYAYKALARRRQQREQLAAEAEVLGLDRLRLLECEARAAALERDAGGCYRDQIRLHG